MSHFVVRLGRRVLPLLALVPLALPGQAEASNVGVGTVMGAVTFTNPGGLPPVGGGCADTTFILHDVVAHAFVLNTVLTGYAGKVDLSGGGSGFCENATLGGGTLNLTATGRVETTGSEITCATLTGSYIRVATELTTLLFGSCTLNDFDTSKVTFIAEINFTPDNPGADVNDPVVSASFAGGFTVSPS